MKRVFLIFIAIFCISISNVSTGSFRVKVQLCNEDEGLRFVFDGRSFKSYLDGDLVAEGEYDYDSNYKQITVTIDDKESLITDVTRDASGVTIQAKYGDNWFIRRDYTKLGNKMR